MKPSAQCLKAANKAMSILGMVKRNFWRLVNSFNVIYDYEGYIWPHLEFCIQAWSPFLARDKLVLENVHRRATKLVCGLKNKSYEERLRDLGLTTLETRRLRRDLIETYKILHWKSHIDHCQLFELVTNGHELRGRDLKLYKQYNRLNTRKHFFSQRVINAWNKLPSSVVDAASVNSIKRNLDDFWKDMGIKS